MNSFGQLQLEAIVCFAALLGMLWVFLGSVNSMALQAEEAGASLRAKANAEMCCLSLDSALLCSRCPLR